MQFLVLITVAILGANITLARPTPTPPFVPGDVAMAKPKKFQNALPQAKEVGKHPAIVLTHPDKDGIVKVATMSHNHPFIDAKYIHKGGLYGLRDHPVKGESSVNVAGPDSVHVKHLSHIYRMSDHHFNALKTAIQKNCPEALKRRGDSDKTKLDPCNRSSIATHAIEIFSTTGTRNRRKQLKNNRQTGKNRQHSPQNGHGAPHNSHTSGPSSQPYHAAPGPSSHQGNGGGGSSSNDKRKH